MTNRELGNAIRQELKNAGIPARSVSVRVRDCGYSTDVHATIKDIHIRKDIVEGICNKHEHIRWDPYAQEILQGCNTYVFVEYDRDMWDSVIAPYMDEAQKIRNADYSDGCGKVIMEKDGKQLIYFAPSWDRPFLHIENSSGKRDRMYCYDERAIAKGIALFDIHGYFVE